MPSLDALVRDVNDLVPLPKAYIRIRELVNDPDSSMHEISQIITNDPALTGRILRIANSAYMGLITKVDSVQRAVQVLGLQQVHDLALATTAVEALSKIKPTAIDLQSYWRRSIYSAIVARLLGKRKSLPKHERLFVAGLLHDVGHLVLAYKEPALYAQIRTSAVERQVPLQLVEREVLGFDYTAISAALVHKWQLPLEIVEPVRDHCSDLSKLGGTRLRETAVTHLAAAISRAAQWKSAADDPVPTFDLVAVHLMSIDDEAVTEIMSQADVAIIEAMTLLLPRSARSVGAKSRRATTR